MSFASAAGCYDRGMVQWAPIVFVLGILRDIAVFLRGRPKVTLDGVRRSPLWAAGAPIYDVTQVWLKNRALRTTAKEVTAMVEFYDHGASAPRLAVHGQWATTHAPGHIGFSGFRTATDIAAGHTPVKLLVLLKYPADSSAYAFAAENFFAHPDGRHPDFALPAGEYRMRVSLAGPDVARTFWFDVLNDGAGVHPVVTATDW
jgi:hypothetical protein